MTSFLEMTNQPCILTTKISVARDRWTYTFLFTFICFQGWKIPLILNILRNLTTLSPVKQIYIYIYMYNNIHRYKVFIILALVLHMTNCMETGTRSRRSWGICADIHLPAPHKTKTDFRWTLIAQTRHRGMLTSIRQYCHSQTTCQQTRYVDERTHSHRTLALHPTTHESRPHECIYINNSYCSQLRDIICQLKEPKSRPTRFKSVNDVQEPRYLPLSDSPATTKNQYTN